MEADVSDGDGHPDEEIGDCDEILEPGEDGRGAGGGGHVGEEADGSCDGDAVVWDATE